jgi:curli biogenesis system outer membrane secretion channel CsgG
MKAIPIIAAFVLGILVSCAPSTQTTTQSGAPITPRADGKQARLAVLSFSGQNGRELSDSLNTALFRTGRFILLEREGISGLQSEAAIGQNPTAFEGADVVVLGSITAFEPNAGGTGGGGVGINLPFIGGLKFGANEAYIAADLRIVEVKTRRILNIVRVEGRSSSFSVGGVGGGFLGPVFIGGSLGTYANQPMGKAIAVMLDAAVRDLAKGIPEVYYVDPTTAPTPAAKPATTGNQVNAVSDLTGLWKGLYPCCGEETVVIQQTGDNAVAIKTVGDKYVPAGQITWRANVRTGVGEAQGAEEGFVNPRFSPATLRIIDNDNLVISTTDSTDKFITFSRMK